MPITRVSCCMPAQFSCAAFVALQLAARHRSRIICHTRMAGVWMSSVACCMLPPGAHALEAKQPCTHARADALVGMAGADEAVGRKASVAHARPVHWPQPPWHILCTAAAPHPSLQSSVGLQLARIAATSNAAEKALLAGVTEKTPDASYTELLRLFKVRRRRWAVAALVASCVLCDASGCHT